jgi:hypothetical protein
MKRPLALASLALAAAASTAVLSASPASATPTGLPGCPENTLCVWTGSDYTGQVSMVRPGGGCADVKTPIRSAANNFKGGGPGIPIILVVYSGANCKGEVLTDLQRGEFAPTLPSEGLSAYSAW